MGGIAACLFTTILAGSFCISLCVETAIGDPGLYIRPEPPGKTKYYIGGWDAGDTIKDFMGKFKPILQDYLTAVVGPLHNPHKYRLSLFQRNCRTG